MNRSIFLILLLPFLSCSLLHRPSKPQIDQSKIEPLYKAAKAVDASVAVSVTLPKFRELIQSCATELSISRDKATTTDEKKLVELFAHILLIYHDSLQLWDAQVKQNWDMAIVCSGEVLAICERNGLKCLKWPYQGKQVIPYNSMQYLWVCAGIELRNANSFYFNDPNLVDKRDLNAIKTAFYEPLIHLIEEENIAQNKFKERTLIASQKQKEVERIKQQRLGEIARESAVLSAAEREKEAREYEENTRIRQQAFEERQRVILASKRAVGSSSALYIDPDIKVYHRSTCMFHLGSWLPILPEDIPRGFKACPTCLPPTLPK